MRRFLTTTAVLYCAIIATAQNIDFNMTNRQQAEVNEPGYISWAVDQVASASKTLDNGLTVTVAATGQSNILRAQWHKNTCKAGQNGQTGLRLMGDGVMSFILDSGNNTPNQTTVPMSISVTVKGLPVGPHTIAAYHVHKDPKKGTMPTIKVDVVRRDQVNGDSEDASPEYVNTPLPGLTGVEFVNVKDPVTSLKMSDAAFSYVEFDIIQEGQPITLTYTTEVADGTTYQTTCMMLNGLLIDRSPLIAMDPVPGDTDYHTDADNGSCTLSWAASTVAVKHKLIWGTDQEAVATATDYQYEGSDTYYTISGLSSSNRYYWRVDEVDASGKVFKGNVWSFQPRHLAFPGAEGYGRFAIGGRGGRVYHVTNLSGDANKEGSLLYGLTTIDEPRYIVFDVSGIIELDFSSHFIKPYATIAGQTAPGKGICIKASNINVGSDVICRHIRFKRGLGVYGENTGNALGMSGANHAIVDHCTAAWGTDETVSGRGAQNVSFQYSVISEALGIAGHKNYANGTNHGYAATIGGQTGSWHHNLLINCNGRNWSMGGGMDANNIPIGGLDLFNNVCYNWNERTTDGNCHAVNFVNNYYKMGPDTRKKILFTQDFEDAINPLGMDQAFISGNIRENKDHSLTHDKLDDTYNATGNIPTNYQYRVGSPLFPSYATIHTAKDALKIVTSYSGAIMPQPDEHHQRNVKETLQGTWTYKGSKSGIKGEIDSETDITEHPNGWEDYPEEHRTAVWDTDQDGMPDWWEQCIGSNPMVANHNDDPDGDGWTLLEDYLDFMAHPYLIVKAGSTVSLDLKPYFAGFYGQNGKTVTPTYSPTQTELATLSVNGSVLTASAKGNHGVATIAVTVNDGETTFTQPMGIAVTDGANGIHTVNSEEGMTSPASRYYYDLSGRHVSQPVAKGIYIHQGKKHVVLGTDGIMRK